MLIKALFFVSPIPMSDFKGQCRAYGGIAKKKVCCAKACGKCGGRGCGRRPGGKKNCCGAHIKKTCGENGNIAPCIMRGNVLLKRAIMLIRVIFCYE